MPKVGKKEFDYTEKGKTEAKAYAKETGQEVKYPTYDAGGRVETYRVGGEVEKDASFLKSDNPEIQKMYDEGRKKYVAKQNIIDELEKMSPKKGKGRMTHKKK